LRAPRRGSRAGVADALNGGDLFALLNCPLRGLGGRCDIANSHMDLDGELAADMALHLLGQVFEHGGTQLRRTRGDQQIAALELRQHQLLRLAQGLALRS
jgi:hypothetical protein